MSKMPCLQRLLFACLAGSLVSCAAIGRINLLTTEKEVEIGREVAREIERELKLYKDPLVTAYINGLGQRLAGHSLRKDVKYHFKVVDTDDVNAFAVPGGWLYVNRGLITTAENESELAGVLSHEIGHVEKKHGARALSRQIGIAVVVDAILGGKDASMKRRVIGQVFAFSSGTLQLKYGRDAEREADRFAVEATHAAGIDPEGMATFFEKLMAMRKKEPGTLANLFSTHPPSGERVTNVRSQIHGLTPKAGLTLDSLKFQAIKKWILIREKARRAKRQ